MAKAIAECYDGRGIVIRKYSAEAAGQIEDESLDFVYIDANHSYENVLQDLTLWGRKVRPGRYIIGHDYREECEGVRRAVQKYCLHNDIKIFTVGRTDDLFVIRKETESVKKSVL